MKKSEFLEWKLRILESLGGDEDLLRELCMLFEKHIDPELSQLRSSISKGDHHAMGIHAHKIKGMLSNFDHPEISKKIRELEDGIQAEEDIRELSMEFETDLQSFRNRLSVLRAKAS